MPVNPLAFTKDTYLRAIPNEFVDTNKREVVFLVNGGEDSQKVAITDESFDMAFQAVWLNQPISKKNNTEVPKKD